MYNFKIAAAATKHFPANRPVLPEWTRHAWASMNERDWWESYLQAAQDAWIEMEKWTVVHGHRQAAWITFSSDQLLEQSQWAVDHGIILIPKEKIAAIQGSYSSTALPSVNDAPFVYRALLVRPESYVKANGKLTDDQLGELLGFPACCREAFTRTWGADQVDSTYDQYVQSGSADGPVEANMLWRWKCIRWVHHLPCSFACEATVELGKRYRAAIIEQGYKEEALTIDTVLRWPVLWSAINGIAEIVGPCLKISTRTDWSPEQRMFKRQGTYTAPDPTLWVDNGFGSASIMKALHAPLVDAMVTLVPKNGKVYDLGCGNGFLLKRLKMHRSDVKIGGIDRKEDVILRAKSGLVGSWMPGQIQDLNWPTEGVTTAVISPIRLTEMSEEDAARVRDVLKTIPQVFVYGYEDCINAYRSLSALCKVVNLPIPAIISGNPKVQVGVIQRG